MKILFIRPKQSPETIGLQHIIICEPLELEVLAALVNSSDEVKIIDMILEKKNIDHHIRSYKPDVVCVTGYITNIPQMISYCRMAKKINSDIITITGGVHIEKFPEDVNDISVDYRVVRNATRTFPKLLHHIKGNGGLPKGILSYNEPLEEHSLPEFDFYFPRPRRDLTAHYRDKYFYIFHDKVSLLKTSFGCPYNCNFCFCIKITNHNYFTRPIDDVLDELESIEGEEIYIVDDDFIVSPKRIRMFIDGLKERKIDKKYLIFGRADFIVKNPGLIEEFKAVGLSSVIVGFESFSDDELKDFNKEIEADVNEKAMEILNNNKIDCYASVIVHPSWDKKDFKLFWEKAKRLGIEYVVLQPLTPYPGTGFQVDEDKMLIKRNDFVKWDLAHVSIKPENMALADYYLNIIKMYNKIAFSPGNILKHFKYSFRMQWKIIKGLILIHHQYKKRYREALKHV